MEENKTEKEETKQDESELIKAIKEEYEKKLAKQKEELEEKHINEMRALLANGNENENINEPKKSKDDNGELEEVSKIIERLTKRIRY